MMLSALLTDLKYIKSQKGDDIEVLISVNEGNTRYDSQDFHYETINGEEVAVFDFEYDAKFNEDYYIDNNELDETK